jgi:hypothetical protein
MRIYSSCLTWTSPSAQRLPVWLVFSSVMVIIYTTQSIFRSDSGFTGIHLSIFVVAMSSFWWVLSASPCRRPTINHLPFRARLQSPGKHLSTITLLCAISFSLVTATADLYAQTSILITLMHPLWDVDKLERASREQELLDVRLLKPFVIAICVTVVQVRLLRTYLQAPLGF